jgi:hypothetical protein
VEGSDGGERERGEELGQSRGSRGVWEREIVDVSGSVDEWSDELVDVGRKLARKAKQSRTVARVRCLMLRKSLYHFSACDGSQT